MEYVKNLKPEHLQSFWFFASKINLAIIANFGCMMWATSETKEEREFYRQQLAEFRWTLRLSSAAADFMKFTVTLLDDSPVFASDPSRQGTDSSDRQSSQNNDSPRMNAEEMVGQFTPQDMPTGSSSYTANFEYDGGLNPNEYWLEYSASAFGGAPAGPHGEHLAATITPPEYYNPG